MFASNGWFGQYDSSGNFVGLGSAVLISPHYILLTGHELTSTSYTALQFGLGSNALTDPGETRSIVETILYPDYPGGGAWGGSTNDIAICRLSDGIFDVTPATFRTDSSLDLVGEHVWMAGYGIPGTYAGGSLPTDGEERAGENAVNRIGWGTFGIGTNYLVAEFAPAWSHSSLPYEWMGAAGDSGGAWLTDSGELVALTNFGQAGSTLGIRVSLYSDWINETIASVPEPSSILLLTVAGFVMLPRILHRRRRAA